ncbi:MAG: ABC transporter permease [Candidatus Acidiferrales bacterium]|jgi:putative ABC transport system permease protein
MRVLVWLEMLWQDIRFATRTLRKNRSFAAIAVLTLALGIGSTTVIFSVIYGALLNPFPYKDFSRSIRFFAYDVSRPDDMRDTFSIPEFLAFREQSRVFEDLVGSYEWDVRYNDGKTTRKFIGAWMTTNGIQYYGVPPLLGRGFAPEDGRPRAAPVFLMNYRFWQREFNGDRNILGRTFTLNDEPRTLIGVMPQRFEAYSGADLYLPLGLYPGAAEASFFGRPASLYPMGRLMRGISLRAAAADLNVIAHRLAIIDKASYPKTFSIGTETTIDSLLGGFRRVLYVLLAAVLLLLFIACTNVANLLLARASVREREIAIREAIGASRGRLILQLLIESFVIATAACIAGCAMAYVGLKGVVAAIPADTLPGEAEIALNPAVLVFSLGVTLATTLLCGLAPAIHAVGHDLHSSLMGSGTGSSAGLRHGRFRTGLVISEVALSIVLLIGAGLLLRSFFALRHVELGVNPTSIVYAQLATPTGRYDTGVQKKILIRPILERVRTIPGVIDAAESASWPPYGGFSGEVSIAGKSHSGTWEAETEMVSEGFFETLELPLTRGKFFSRDDVDSARHVIVINQTLTRQFFGNADPIGQELTLVGCEKLPEAPRDCNFEIIGVAGDYRNAGVRNSVVPQVFIPYTFTGVVMDRTIVVRSSLASEPLLKEIYGEVSAVDPDVGFRESGTIESFLQNLFQQRRFELATVGAFAGIGLLLVLVGIFSVTAYTVSLQTHEIGIRMALGAQPRNVLRLVVAKGFSSTATGALIGLVASWGLTRFLASRIWGVSATDPWTFASVFAGVIVVGVAASLPPARRATRVDPMVALRYE